MWGRKRKQSNSNGSNGRKKGGRVRFAPERKNTVARIPNLGEYADDEIAALWYRPHELHASFADTVARMEAGTVPSSDPSARGLESRTSRGNSAKMQKRYAAYKRVLDEQDRQWDAQKKEDAMVYDDDALRTAYCQDDIPGRDRELALARARGDADDAREILADVLPPRRQPQPQQRQAHPDQQHTKENEDPAVQPATNFDRQKGGPVRLPSSTSKSQSRVSIHHRQQQHSRRSEAAPLPRRAVCV